MTLALRPFAEAVEDVSRGSAKILQSEFEPHGSIPIVDQGRALIAGYTDDRTLICKVPAPAIVFGDHTRALKYVDFSFAIGADGVKVLRVKSGWDPKYVYHYLVSCPIPSAGYSRHFKFLKELRIPQPPIDEQRRIAAILDQADELRAKRRQALAHLDDLTESIFLDMFGHPAGNGLGWPVDNLGSLASTTSGGTPSRAEPGSYGGAIPWVKSGELHTDLVTNTEEHITERGLERSSAKLMPVGTVLVAMYGATAGAVSVLGVEAATNQAICSMQVGQRLTRPYLVAALRSMNVSLLSSRSGGAQPNLSQGQLRSLVLPVPPRELQTDFDERLERLSVLRSRMVSAEPKALFASLQSRAFSGQL